MKRWDMKLLDHGRAEEAPRGRGGGTGRAEDPAKLTLLLTIEVRVEGEARL